jgi:hypothetical protein
VNGYSGVADASISDLYYSSSSNPTGTTFKTNDTLYVYALDYTTKALLKFDVSPIPPTAGVLTATLDVTIESWIGPQTVAGSFITTPWSYAGANFGWTNTGAGSVWSYPGLGLADVHGPVFEFSGITASGYQRKSVALDAASVQSWVRSRAANQGVILINREPNKVLRIFSSEAANPAQRPTLSVTYRL